MIKKLKFFFLIIFAFILFPSGALASSSYVLPYPAVMPGSVFYKLDLLQDEIAKYWYFGNFGQFRYNLKQSDKYLVEAKTLLEYKQYLLGFNALNKSNSYFSKIYPYLTKAQKEGKDASESLNIFRQASLKHKEVLTKMREDTPEKFNWTPEKSDATMLDFKKAINYSIEQRNKYL
jgi:hypothetical protein